MERIKQSIREDMEQCIVDIRENLEALNINASHRTERSLRVKEDGDHMRIVIGGTGDRTAPAATLEVGRAGGKVPKNFKAIIYQWSLEKGIACESDSHRWAFATSVARKIEAEGTDRYKNNVDSYSALLLALSVTISNTCKGMIKAEIDAKINDIK